MNLRPARSALASSLINILLAVVIICTIAAIVTPRILRSKFREMRVANEASAMATLRTLGGRLIIYKSTYGKGFAPSLAALGPTFGGDAPGETAAGLIDPALANGWKSGYVFTYTPIDTDTDGKVDAYTITAHPADHHSEPAGRYFFTDQSNVIRYNVGASATLASFPIPP